MKETLGNRKQIQKILILTDSIGVLTRERGRIGLAGGFEIHWFSGNYVEMDGIKVYSVPPGKNRKWAWVRRMIRLKHLIRTIKPDIVHVFWANQFFLNLVLRRVKPLVVTVMGGDFLPERLNKFPFYVQWMIKLLLDRAQVVTSKSDFMDSALRKRGIPSHKIERISWGVDLFHFKPGLLVDDLRRELNLQQLDFVFFSPRIGKPIYNHHTIIEAFSLLMKNTHKRVVLLMATAGGEKKYISHLNSLVENFKLTENIRMLEEIPHEQMPLYFNLADCAIAIPWSDGMPQSLYETMACGCFNILGNLPQYKELITDRFNGLFVPLDNPEKLCETMIWIMENENIRNKAVEYNRNLVSEIADKKKETEKMIKIYRDLVSRFPK